MEMTKEVIEVPFEGVAVRKLHDLFERGYTVCGVAIQRIHQSGNFDRGAITTGGMVMWWPAHGSTDALLKKIAELEAMLDAVGAGGVGESIKAQAEAPAQQKPVAWINWNALTGKRSLGWECDSELASEPLYAAPQPARQPLTDEQISEIYANNKINPMRFARAIEAAVNGSQQ